MTEQPSYWRTDRDGERFWLTDAGYAALGKPAPDRTLTAAVDAAAAAMYTAQATAQGVTAKWGDLTKRSQDELRIRAHTGLSAALPVLTGGLTAAEHRLVGALMVVEDQDGMVAAFDRIEQLYDAANAAGVTIEPELLRAALDGPPSEVPC